MQVVNSNGTEDFALLELEPIGGTSEELNKGQIQKNKPKEIAIVSFLIIIK
jgi:hypothetical protein